MASHWSMPPFCSWVAALFAKRRRSRPSARSARSISPGDPSSFKMVIVALRDEFLCGKSTRTRKPSFDGSAPGPLSLAPLSHWPLVVCLSAELARLALMPTPPSRRHADGSHALGSLILLARTYQCCWRSCGPARRQAEGYSDACSRLARQHKCYLPRSLGGEWSRPCWSARCPDGLP